MYFWKIEKLKQDIIEDKVSRFDYGIYLSIFIILNFYLISNLINNYNIYQKFTKISNLFYFPFILISIFYIINIYTVFAFKQDFPIFKRIQQISAINILVIIRYFAFTLLITFLWLSGDGYNLLDFVYNEPGILVFKIFILYFIITLILNNYSLYRHTKFLRKDSVNDQ